MLKFHALVSLQAAIYVIKRRRLFPARQAILGSQTTMSIDKRSGQRQEMEGIIWEVFLGFGSILWDTRAIL